MPIDGGPGGLGCTSSRRGTPPPHPFYELTVPTEVTGGLATQSRGLVCATEKSFTMQLVEGVRHFIRAGLEDGNSADPI